jgi:hypothetical protein
LEIRMLLDRINFRIEEVHVDDFQRFLDSLDTVERMGLLNVRREFRKGVSEYAYNLHIGQGDGAVYIGYRHNSANAKMEKERFHMKVEFNPNKHSFDEYKQFWLCMTDFREYKKGIKSIDLAFDLYGVSIDSIVPVSLTGKWMNKFQGTFYFGQRGSYGFLRIYDKAKEEGLKDEAKTRVEFTIEFPEATTFQIFQSVSSYDVFEQYIVSVVDYDKLDAEMACILFSLHHAFRSLKEFSRRKQEKIKKALLETERIDFQTVFDEQKEAVFQAVRKCLNFEWYENSISESVPF